MATGSKGKGGKEAPNTDTKILVKRFSVKNRKQWSILIAQSTEI